MKIKIDYKLDNWNDTIKESRTNKYKAGNKKKEEMEIIEWFLIGIKPIKKYPIKIECEWHVKNINQDLDNKSLKSVLDAMQKTGILANDNLKHINEILHKAVKDVKDYLILNIKEFGGENNE